MKLAIDVLSGVPIYTQIVDQVKRAIVSGELTRGAKLPTVRRLAADLNVHVNTVAHAYIEMERAGIVSTRPGLGTFVVLQAEDQRLVAERESRLQGMVGRILLEAFSLGYSPEQVEAALVLRLAQWRSLADAVEAVEAPAKRPTDAIATIGSHDLTLDVLAGELRRRVPPLAMTSAHVGSLGGLIALARGEAHIAGCHLLDEETGEYNLPYIKRLLPGQEVVLVNLVYRIQGLILPKGNPRGLKDVTDLARQDVTFVNRQQGSGTRVLLDYKLRLAGIPREKIGGYEREANTHFAVAAAVAGGTADTGLGILAAARAFELDFVPLGRERYDLAMLRRNFVGPLLGPLLEVVRSASFRRVVEELGGYDTSQTGEVVGETVG